MSGPRWWDLSGWRRLSRLRLTEGRFDRAYDLQSSAKMSQYFQMLPHGSRPEWSGIALAIRLVAGPNATGKPWPPRHRSAIELRQAGISIARRSTRGRPGRSAGRSAGSVCPAGAGTLAAPAGQALACRTICRTGGDAGGARADTGGDWHRAGAAAGRDDSRCRAAPSTSPAAPTSCSSPAWVPARAWPSVMTPGQCI